MPTKIVERVHSFPKNRPIPSRGWIEHEIVGGDARNWKIRYRIEEKILDSAAGAGIDSGDTRETDPQTI